MLDSLFVNPRFRIFSIILLDRLVIVILIYEVSHHDFRLGYKNKVMKIFGDVYAYGEVYVETVYHSFIRCFRYFNS